jgi:hypothetical protein
MCRGSEVVAELTDRDVYCEQAARLILEQGIQIQELVDGGMDLAQLEQIPESHLLFENPSICRQILNITGQMSDAQLNSSLQSAINRCNMTLLLGKVSLPVVASEAVRQMVGVR